MAARENGSVGLGFNRGLSLINLPIRVTVGGDTVVGRLIAGGDGDE